MNGTHHSDRDRADSIDTADKRHLSPLRDGAQRIKNPTREADGGTTTLELQNDRPLIDVNGQYLEAEPGHVELKISMDAAQFRTSMSTERARELAQDLDYAARGVEDPGEVTDE